MAYKGVGYIVTAQHVIAQMGDGPFAVRMNLDDGSTIAFHNDAEMGTGGKWFTLDDPTVDLAVRVLEGESITLGSLMPNWILTDEILKSLEIGVGDVCYTVGLFRLLAGDQKNIPVVHTGNLALLAGEQRIPVENWLGGSEPILADSHLVEQTNLDGLSGAPVFARPTIVHGVSMQKGGTRRVRVGDNEIKLLGVWQASWDGLAASPAQRRGHVRVAIGMGAVSPQSMSSRC